MQDISHTYFIFRLAGSRAEWEKNEQPNCHLPWALCWIILLCAILFCLLGYICTRTAFLELSGTLKASHQSCMVGMYIHAHTFVCNFHVCELCWTDNHENLTFSSSKQQCEKQLYELWILAGQASHTIKHGSFQKQRTELHPAILILPSNKITCSVLQENPFCLSSAAIPGWNSLTSVTQRVRLDDQSSLILKIYEQKEGNEQLTVVWAVLLSTAQAPVHMALHFLNCLIKTLHLF